MAVRIIHLVTDDLDGSEGAETVMFGLDGAAYSIDLSDVHARELRLLLEPYVAAGTRVRGEGLSVTARQATDRVESYKIRAWAQRNGKPIAARGRIPASIVEAYRAAA
uniref:histone-like nucleoid-structuring protein Lsr2 n=1 Tax=Paractinoplanes polyasparticus TaxID=2856853 RepID=UPI001C84E6BC|nr:Lsr2 family protein [Actinoplanes polyasparticus]